MQVWALRRRGEMRDGVTSEIGLAIPLVSCLVVLNDLTPFSVSNISHNIMWVAILRCGIDVNRSFTRMGSRDHLSGTYVAITSGSAAEPFSDNL
jgi:hypothetical protein